MSHVTRLIDAAAAGDRQAAADLLPLVYDELRKLAAARLADEKPGQTLQPTALVHEAYLRLVGNQGFEGRHHFFAAAADAMRRILIDRARAPRAASAEAAPGGASPSTTFGWQRRLPATTCSTSMRRLSGSHNSTRSGPSW
jgi:RNA polymerase sigma factor (TIGR02999 family)